MKRRESDSG